ncbi:hypothetical protein BH09VER1_BH09VER1_12450 [soil metagenome]
MVGLSSFPVGQTLHQAIEDPLYAHVLINHLPEMGLGLALIALVAGFVLRCRKVRMVGLFLVLVTSASAWPVLRTGQEGYNQIYYSLESEDRAWLDAHMEEAEKWIWGFLAVAGLALAGLLVPIKWPRAETFLTLGVLIAGLWMFLISGYIAYLGGRVRHVEFRDTPPPAVHHE